MSNTKIKELRERAKITQRELASALNVTQTAVNYWENGKRGINMDMIKKIADYFEVTPSYLMGIDDELNQRMYEDAVRLEAALAYNDLNIQDLIEKYDSLTDIGKEMILNYADLLSKSPEYNKNSIPNQKDNEPKIPKNMDK